MGEQENTNTTHTRFDSRTQVETSTSSRRKRRGPLKFRLHKDYDIARDEFEGLVILRVFAPVKRIRPDHRFLVLRRELRINDDGSTRWVAIYRGDVDRDAPQVKITDGLKFYYAFTEASEHLAMLETKFEERRGFSPKGNVYRDPDVITVPSKHSATIPDHVVNAVKDLPSNVDARQLRAAEQQLARYIVEDVDTSEMEPEKVAASPLINTTLETKMSEICERLKRMSTLSAT